MRIYSSKSVLDAAKDRIRYLFDEFPDVLVSVSGGKDSTIVYHLALEVAREKGRLPLKVMFLDQEAEWEATIDHVRELMYDPDVEPLWYQCRFRLSNAASHTEHYLVPWDPDEEHRWMRQREPIAITETPPGGDRFHAFFERVLQDRFPNQKACYLTGMRVEEAPTRGAGLLSYFAYKWVTWGKKLNPPYHFSFSPIYDWSYTDVWKAIHSHGWSYNRLYDRLYNQGVASREMRVSSLCHEIALRGLLNVQEVEPETWSRLTERLTGVDSVAKLEEDFLRVTDKPAVFETWEEYRDHLAENLLDAETLPKFRKMFAQWAKRAEGWKLGPEHMVQLHRREVDSILCNDPDGLKILSWRHNPTMVKYLREKGVLKERNHDIK